ncbi:winged helix-turn-helix domain-containing protein [Serratia marcescens]|uniref:winged helix-turn-helix domain-containing protein n=1 Tax=Serratia marcescens TaxID=615 RepID=UPI000975A89E|nr:winged helix-turn-helix domain-containing protein [Serratia marcescens]MDY7605647.1 winged helix-turn-helix domain-containing protein [Serratia marcescens]OMP53996.1 hypothetical protein BES32_13435 [Serratia marcescens]
MKYIINLTIIFDPDSRLLMLRNNPQLTIGLSKPATRLLTELIINNKIELTRETLIKHVWEDYGFSPSSATLSNHVSELRKAFEALGVNKNILSTVPRTGFKMDADIHPETKPPQELVLPQHAEPLQPENEKKAAEHATIEPLKVSSKKSLRRMQIPVLSLFLFLIITTGTAVWMVLHKNEKFELIGLQNKCHFYTLDEAKHAPQQFQRAQRMLGEEGIDCTQAERDIYYMEARPTNNLLKIYFMAACVKNSDISYTNCNNFKRVE